MRVVAGELKGRRLTVPRGRNVRPTSDRARRRCSRCSATSAGSTCSTSMPASRRLRSRRFREAPTATLVDVDPAAARANVASLDLEGRANVVAGDAVGFLRAPGAPFDLILCDPPYRLAARLGPRPGSHSCALACAPAARSSSSSARDPLEVGLEPWRERRYGEEALLRIYRP